VNLIVRRINRSDRRTSGFPLAINIRANIGGTQANLLQKVEAIVFRTHFVAGR